MKKKLIDAKKSIKKRSKNYGTSLGHNIERLKTKRHVKLRKELTNVEFTYVV